MNRELVRKVADAVLYEGYMLYPYRPSAIKNRQRWSFGILYPPAYAEVPGGTERCAMHSECLVEAAGDAALHIELRFLHLLARQVAKSHNDHTEVRELPQKAEGAPHLPQSANVGLSPGRTDQLGNRPSHSKAFEPVPLLVVDGQPIESWDEGVERTVDFELTLPAASQEFHFRFPASHEAQLLRDNLGQLAGIVSRTQHEVFGTVSVSSEELRDGLLKLTIDVANRTSLEHDPQDRNFALLRSLLSAHTVLSVSGGQFISLLDPPEELREAASACHNLGNFPVLAGEPPAPAAGAASVAAYPSAPAAGAASVAAYPSAPAAGAASVAAYPSAPAAGAASVAAYPPAPAAGAASVAAYPPAPAAGAASVAAYPSAPQRDMLLCSPIVLYDYPQIAPESANAFYDATEMDEMLTLRVMTLTDEEKNEARSADPNIRNLLERTEQSAREQLTRTHGTIRSLRPVSGDKP